MDINRIILENILLEYLIPPDFWDPVKVSLSSKQIESISSFSYTDECAICFDSKDNFKFLSCCRNRICDSCTLNWFNESVHCPYCKADLREILES